MLRGESVSARSLALHRWLGVLCLFGIIPIKVARVVGHDSLRLLTGWTPSFLGAAGLLFLLLSEKRVRFRRPRGLLALFVGTVAFAIEYAQLLPRPGILRYVEYRFDFGDLVASGAGVVFAGIVSIAIESANARRKRPAPSTSAEPHSRGDLPEG